MGQNMGRHIGRDTGRIRLTLSAAHLLLNVQSAGTLRRRVTAESAGRTLSATDPNRAAAAGKR
jgi:hypothetical protein